MTVTRWVVVVAAVLVLVGLLGYARGDDHHRGHEVGVQAAGVSLVLGTPGGHGGVS
jgi:hypothetical protein